MHVLVVGGTGMLAGVSLHLAGRGGVVSVVGRSAAKHDALRKAASGLSGVVSPLRLDYCDSSVLTDSLSRSIEDHGPISEAVCWIHRTAPDAPGHIAELLAGGGRNCLYLDVLGSSGLSAFALERCARLQALPGLTYRRVLLGCMPLESGWRWLTDDEISAGVIAALYSRDDSFQVGSPVPDVEGG